MFCMLILSWSRKRKFFTVWIAWNVKPPPCHQETFRKWITLDTPNKLTRIHKKVLPLLTAPPNPVRTVSALLVNFVFASATVLSNVMLTSVYGNVLRPSCRSFVEYEFFVQGGLHLNLWSCWYKFLTMSNASFPLREALLNIAHICQIWYTTKLFRPVKVHLKPFGKRCEN